MVEAWQAGDPLSRLEANHLGFSLLPSIFRQYGHLSPRQVRSARALVWVPSYLSFHIGEPVSVVDMTPCQPLPLPFQRRVSRAVRPIARPQYLLRMRLEQAQELLRTTDLPLWKIAESCGFADVHNFAKAFKRLVDVSPRAYRHRDPGDG